MGCEVKTDMGGQDKCSLWGSNVKMEIFAPGPAGVQFDILFWAWRVVMLCGANQLELFFPKG